MKRIFIDCGLGSFAMNSGDEDFEHPSLYCIHEPHTNTVSRWLLFK